MIFPNSVYKSIGTLETGVSLSIFPLQLSDSSPAGTVCVLHVDGRCPVRGRAAGAAHGHREAAHPRQHLGLLLLTLLPNHHQATASRCVGVAGLLYGFR